MAQRDDERNLEMIHKYDAKAETLFRTIPRAIRSLERKQYVSVYKCCDHCPGHIGKLHCFIAVNFWEKGEKKLRNQTDSQMQSSGRFSMRQSTPTLRNTV